MGIRSYSPAALGSCALLALLGCRSDFVPVGEPRAPRASTPRASTPRASIQAPVPSETQAVRERPALGPDPDLDAYLRLGLENNPALRAAFDRWQAARERIVQATTWPEPRLGYTEFLEEIETRTGPQERRFSLSQQLPWPSELRSRKGMATHASDAQEQALEAIRLEVAETIALAYFDYAYLATSERITAQTLELLHQLEPAVRARIQSGGKQADLLRLQVEIGKLENELAGLGKLKPAYRARLAVAVDLPAEAPLPTPELVAPVVRPLETNELHELAHERSPQLAALDARLRGSEDALRLAETRRLPDLTLGVDYLDTGSARMSGVSGSGDDPVGLSFSVSLPVWGRSYAAAEREQVHRRRALQHEREDVEGRLHADLELELFRADDAARQIALHRDSLLPRARETLELTVSSYRTADASLLDLIDVERSQLEFERAYWRAARDYHQSQARLRRLIGGPFQ